MKFEYFLLPVFIQVVSAQLFAVEPQASYVVREGDSLTLECRTNEPVSLCGWKLETPELLADGSAVTGFLMSSIPEGLGITAKTPGSDTDCTIEINQVMSRHNGKYICAPFTSGGQKEATPAELIIAQKPVTVEFSGAQAGQFSLTVSADEPVNVTCEARDARPKAELRWFLAERELFEGVTVANDEDPGSKLVTTRSTLLHQFGRSDDGQKLRCEARHQGYAEDDLREVMLDVMVRYAPFRAEGSDIGTLYGYTAEQDGTVTVNFTANPPPTVMVWSVGDDVQLDDGSQSEDGRFRTSTLQEVDPAQHQYASTLTLSPVKLEDQDLPISLRVANVVGEQVLTLRLGTGAPPPPPPTPEGNQADDAGSDTADTPAADQTHVGMSGGAIAGIIIALLVLLLIIAVVAFGRSRGKWCFAAGGGSGGGARKEWRAHMDSEAGDPTREGHDNPGHEQKAPEDASEPHANGNGKTPTDTPV